LADPHHIAELDGFDRLTVSLYRTGLAGAAIAMMLGAALYCYAAVDPEPQGWNYERLARYVWAVLSLCTTLSIANMHLYDKRVRWLIGIAGVTGVGVQLLACSLPDGAAQHLIYHAGLGLVCVSLSGFAIKEQFCFKIPGLKLVPVFLILALVGLVLPVPLLAGAMLLVSGGLFLVLSVAKVRMPLHFDIGDKSRYQQ